MKSAAERKAKRLRSIPFSIRAMIPWPHHRISDDDRDSFGQVLSTWRPEDEKQVFLLRWQITKWCNYKCPYCPQTHNRFAREGEYTAHAFDNYPLEKWLHAFSRHFHERRLSLVITGGEPLLDGKNMAPLLGKLTSMPTVECIRIDTNASWKPENYKEVDPEKIILMCTYHPSQVAKENFFDSIDKLLEFGYEIGMVNYVMDRSNFDSFQKVKQEMFERGIPLHPNPLWDSKGQYTENDLSLLRETLPVADYHYRTKLASPRGKKCLFPSLGYQMSNTGQIHVGCHPRGRGIFFEDHLPSTFIGPVPCPKKSCVCLDMYSFLEDVNRNEEVNPLRVYSRILEDKYREQNL